MYEALQDLRIQYRWQAMDEENKAVKQAKEKRSNTLLQGSTMEIR